MPKKTKNQGARPAPCEASPPSLLLREAFAQPLGSCSKAQPLGSGAKVQSPATLLWGLTPVEHSTLLWGLTPASSLRLIRRPVTTVVIRGPVTRVWSRRRGRTLTVVIGVVGLFHSSRISRSDTLHDLTVTVVTGDLDGS